MTLTLHPISIGLYSRLLSILVMLLSKLHTQPFGAHLSFFWHAQIFAQPWALVWSSRLGLAPWCSIWQPRPLLRTVTMLTVNLVKSSYDRLGMGLSTKASCPGYNGRHTYVSSVCCKEYWIDTAEHLPFELYVRGLISCLNNSMNVNMLVYKSKPYNLYFSRYDLVKLVKHDYGKVSGSKSAG